MPRIYLDYASVSPLDSRVRAVMLPWLQGAWNAGSLHREGRAARAAVDAARLIAAEAMHRRSREVVFTGSGSESVALAVLGYARAVARPGSFVAACTEHRAVLAVGAQLQEQGWQVHMVPVDADGVIRLEKLGEALEKTVPGPKLVSCMAVNNETGTLTPLRAVAELARDHEAFLHIDAIGIGEATDLSPVREHGDLISLAAQKFSGPAGCGMLIRRESVPLAPLIPGGGQELGLRAGTENVAAIVGGAEALRLREQEYAARACAAQTLQIRLEAALAERFLPEAYSISGRGAARSPSLSHVAFADIDGAALLAALDLAGLAVSAGSACLAGALERSHVVAAMGLPARFSGIVRLSWGRDTLATEIDAAVEILTRVIGRLREVNADRR